MYMKKNCDCGNRPFGPMPMPMPQPMPQMGGEMMNPCGPIIEPVNTTCVEKDFFVDVPHICPIHTHTVNKVHYIHKYTPEYSCSESTEVINNDCGSCCNFINR